MKMIDMARTPNGKTGGKTGKTGKAFVCVWQLEEPARGASDL